MQNSITAAQKSPISHQKYKNKKDISFKITHHLKLAFFESNFIISLKILGQSIIQKLASCIIFLNIIYQKTTKK